MTRNTIQRTAVLTAVREMTNHPTAEQVYGAVSGKCPGISRSTVYRILGNLSDKGEIRRVGITDGPDRFDFTLREHAHSLCECCGRVSDFPLEIGSVGDMYGFEVKSVEITVHGICRECKGNVNG